MSKPDSFDDAGREDMAERVRNADAVFAVTTDSDGDTFLYRGASSEAELHQVLYCALSARAEAREFLDAVAADDPELVEHAEDVWAEVHGGRR